MNENHLRHVAATFHYIDNLLSEAERAMSTAHETSRFGEHVNDTTPGQREVAHEYVRRVRKIMTHRLESLGVPRSTPDGSTLWAARTKVLYANMALADMEPPRMTGFGKLTARDEQRLEQIVAELRAELKELGDYLTQAEDEDPEPNQPPSAKRQE
jgi:hypothetical protein